MGSKSRLGASSWSQLPSWTIAALCIGGVALLLFGDSAPSAQQPGYPQDYDTHSIKLQPIYQNVDPMMGLEHQLESDLSYAQQRMGMGGMGYATGGSSSQQASSMIRPPVINHNLRRDHGTTQQRMPSAQRFRGPATHPQAMLQQAAAPTRITDIRLQDQTVPPFVGVVGGRYAPELRPGCRAQLAMGSTRPGRKVFLDMGGHDGSSIREFIGDDFDKYEIWAWEPNPRHEKAWRSLEAKHRTICYIGKAVYTKVEDLPLFVDQAKAEQKGTGIVRKEYGRMHSDKHTVLVSTEDIHAWMTQNIGLHDEIIVKMDIEGAEFPVLHRMLVNGSACRIKKLFIEFHAKMDPISSKGQLKQNNRDATAHQLVLMEMFKSCPIPVEVEIVA